MHKKITFDSVLKILLLISITIVVAIFLLIVGYIFVTGVPYLSASLFEFEYNSENVSALSSIINTVIIVAISLLYAVPIGICSAIYLVEYAKKGSKIVNMVRITTETLAGIPSIVYGLFGLLMFVVYFKLGYSIISGSLTLAIMILPLIMRTTEEALLAIPDAYREASFGLGAGKFRTTVKVILPSAISGIMGGVMLSVGRIIGETAALIFTAGTVAALPFGNSESAFFMQSARTLSVHMYVLSGEGLHMNEAQATAVILLLLVMVINFIAMLITRGVRKAK